MKIECPDCKLSGNIDDSTVPATGLAMTCPRCKKPFTVERPASEALSSSAMMGSCPKCQYSTFTEEKFAICPKCGLNVADFHNEQLALRQNQKSRPVPPPQVHMPAQSPATIPGLTPEQMQKEEAARRKYGLDNTSVATEAVDEPVSARGSVETPLPVLIAGWGTIITTIILISFGISGIMEYQAKVIAAEAAIAALEEAQSSSAIFFQFLLFPLFSILFSLVMLVLGCQFLAMKKWTISAMRNGALAGVGMLALMKLSDIIFWCRRASADASFGYYAMGILGDVMLLVLYIAPFLVLAEYLKSDLFEKYEDLFF